MKKIIAVGAGLVGSAACCLASGTSIADPNTIVSTANDVAVAATGLGLLLLTWKVGSSIVRRYVK